MANTDETTPLLGAPVPGPSPSNSSSASPPPIAERNPGDRVHFLDNLRAMLTVLLIMHHAAIFICLDNFISPPNHSKSTHIPISLFTTTNRAFLYEVFFFASGYSIRLGLEVKSDSKFLVSRTLKTGLTAYLWEAFVRGWFGDFLALVFGHKVFGRFAWQAMDHLLEGPGMYIFPLLALDYTYLLIRLVGRYRPALATARLEAYIKGSHRRTHSLFALSFAVVALAVGLNCVAWKPAFYRHDLPFEYAGFGMPASYILAYIAGVNFPLIQQHILVPRPRTAAGLLAASLALAYITLGLAQHHWAALRDLIKPVTFREGVRFFPDGGLNAHTAFWVLWSALACFSLVLGLISVFASATLLRRRCGIWTEHTYVQTFVHMAPVAIAAHVLGLWAPTDGAVVKAVLSAAGGVGASWVVALGIFALRRRYARYIPQLDVHVWFPTRNAPVDEE